MAAPQRVSRGFHRLALFLAAIYLLIGIAVTMMIGDKLNFERVAFPCAASKIKQDASEWGVQLYYYDLKDLGCSDTAYVVSPRMVLEASPPNMWVIISEWLVVSLAVALAVYGLVRALGWVIGGFAAT
jgi:hypothetical protein